MKNHEEVIKLAEAHWDFIKGLLVSANVRKEMIDFAAYTYITSFIHGYKHAIQDVENIPIRIKREVNLEDI